MARLQVASHPDRMTPFPLLDFIQKIAQLLNIIVELAKTILSSTSSAIFNFSMFIYDNR